MSLRLLPTEPQGDRPLLDRICALQVARNGLGVGVQSGDPVACAMIVVIDELVAQLRGQCEREGII